ncbi:unnamed protein product [Bursaphelenchus okinawaensis]|uniref:Saposin B-type domain-containing protein n=1 Tax=Bursaphelenchus okinawaensis TaxID=465554 RepID=A0A811LMB3_9BILA|nr:unnamed protein product [Bursaphelenchus okinawaensis]CAG9127964.1 unnamed protein product [Bursaphelenchus okinawaensis]
MLKTGTCPICKPVFQYIHDNLDSIDGLTRDGLKSAATAGCSMSGLPDCAGLVDTIDGQFDGLYHFIVEKEKEIDPEDCCGYLDYC